MKKQSRIGTILGWAVVAFLLLIFVVANYFTVFTTDDLWYGTNLVTGKPLTNFRDILESQIWHYQNWGGRIVAHTLLQITLLGGRIFADISNILMICVLLLLVCWYSGKFSWQSCLFVLGGLVIFNPAWWDNLLWQSGSANYLYTTNFILLYMILFLKTLEKEYDQKVNVVLCIIMPLLGFMAGCSNENMGPTAALLGIIVLGIHIYKKNRVRVWMLIGEVFCGIGCIMMILAPGNSVRNEQITKIEAHNWIEFFKNAFFDKYKNMGWSLFHVILPVIITISILLVIIKALNLKMELCEIQFLVMAAISYLAMFASPHYPDRATYGTIILIICVCARFGTRICMNRPDLKRYINLAILLMDFGMIYTLSFYIFQIKKWI